nr:reverse transcriptase domain-containing protein [Tanacetum cinerariifolium]
HKRAIAWKLSVIKGINSEFYTHKILIEDDFEPAVQHQRRINPKIHDVIKNEVLKLPDAGLVYHIFDSPWVMFEPDIESKVCRKLQGNNVTVLKLFSSCRVHFVRFQNLHIFMLVEKRYPLTHVTITEMLNKKLQADHWNEMCYQLLELMLKQQKKK